MEEEILKDLKTNVLKWYEFKKNAEIVYIGESQELITYLKKSHKVHAIKEIKEINNNKKYDYIIVDTVLINVSDIKQLKTCIEIDSKIIFILDNKYGISNFVTYNYNKQISCLDEEKIYVSIEKICEELKQNEFYINKYMLYPNKNKVDMIINEKYTEISDKIEKYFYNYEDEKVVICDEIKVLKNIQKYDMQLFKKLANSYFIEVSMKPIENDIKYVSYNNYRKEKYRLITKIKQDKVEKQEENEKSKAHIKDIAKNMEVLKGYNFKILDKFENNILYSDFIKNEQTLDMQLAQNYNNVEYIVKILSVIKEELLKHVIKCEQIPNDSICKKIAPELSPELNYLEYAFYDMIPKNCFYIDGEFYFFDQEWMEKYLPVEFIIYRAIINSYDLVRIINVNELLEKLNILKYKEMFEKIDQELRTKLIDIERLKICQKENRKMYEIVYDNKVFKNINNEYEQILKDLKENDEKQDQYIKFLECQIAELQEKKGI